MGVSPLQLVYLHINRRYFVIKLHTWFCLSYFLKTNIKLYCIYQYVMSINSFFNTVSVSRYSRLITNETSHVTTHATHSDPWPTLARSTSLFLICCSKNINISHTHKVSICGYYCLSEDILHIVHKHDLHSYQQLSENWSEKNITDWKIFAYLNFISFIRHKWSIPVSFFANCYDPCFFMTRGRDRMVDGCYLWNQCLSVLTLWVRIPLRRGVLDAMIFCSQILWKPCYALLVGWRHLYKNYTSPLRISTSSRSSSLLCTLFHSSIIHNTFTWLNYTNNMAGILQETGNAYPSRAPLLLIFFIFLCGVFHLSLFCVLFRMLSVYQGIVQS